MKTAAAGSNQVVVNNFSFAPAMTAVAAGATVTKTNRDDVPHRCAWHLQVLLLDSSKDDRTGRGGVSVPRNIGGAER
jgi:plastocyanin